jgi:hypothetical protein
MRSRFVLMSAIVFAGLGAIHPSSAQQISSDVVISGASLNDGYGNSSCDEEGQLYRLRVNPRPGGDAISVQRVAKDGSTQLFTLTRPDWSIQGIAPSAQGLIVLANAGAEMGSHVTRVYRFDTQGNIRSERSVTFDFQPFALAEAKSGMTIVVGYRGKFEMKQDARTVGGAILDADDQVVKTFEFQPAADGSRWRFVSTHRIWADDHGASVILQSSDGDPNFEIATIDESGETKVLPLETVRLHENRSLRHGDGEEHGHQDATWRRVRGRLLSWRRNEHDGAQRACGKVARTSTGCSAARYRQIGMTGSGNY